MNALHVVPPATDPVAELRKNARVLSTEDGPHPARGTLREKLCLLDNNELHIVQAARLDPAVLAYEDELKRAGMRPKIELTSLSDLRQLYARAPAARAATNAAESISGRQAQVLSYINAAVATDTSDMHFIYGKDLGVIRNRVHGVLENVLDMSAAECKELCSTIYQSMCDVADTTFNDRKPQDGRLKAEFLEQAGLYGARIATRPTERGLLMVLRLLYNKGKTHRSLTDLGYLPEQAAQIERLTKKKSGANIYSGPTGSGKSTSLELTFGQVIRNFDFKLNALTIEDPPEYRIEGAVQTPVQNGDWAGAIRNAMRLDPDIMMIGEIRDAASAQATFQGALTGHGVWTTVHANDATTILQRLGDIGLDPGLYTDPSIVTGLINQNLTRRLCPNCKKPWAMARASLPGDLVARVEKYCTPETVYCRGAGCAQCRNTGIAGRTVIAEVISPNLAFMRAFRASGKAEARAYWIREMQGITKIKHLIQRINEGMVDPLHGEQNVGLLDEDDVL